MTMLTIDQLSYLLKFALQKMKQPGVSAQAERKDRVFRSSSASLKCCSHAQWDVTFSVKQTNMASKGFLI